MDSQLALRGVQLTDEQAATVEKIMGLDFRVMLINVTTGWYGDAPELSLDDALEGIRQFRMFLVGYALRLYPSLVPSRKADAIWHAWMNDPTKYARETTELFGAIMPHYGQLGHIGEEGRARRRAGWSNMVALAQVQFGVQMSAEEASTPWCDHSLVGDVPMTEADIQAALDRIMAGDVMVPA